MESGINVGNNKAMLKLPTFVKTLISLACAMALAVTGHGQIEGSDKSIVKKPLEGDWTLRLFQMEQNVSVSADELVFGCWNMRLKEHQDGMLSGSIEKEGWRLPVSGKRTSDTVSLSAKGAVGDDIWQLDWIGNSPAVINQLEVKEQSLVGTAIFECQNDEANDPVLCHWISIKRTPYPTRPVNWKLQDHNGSDFSSFRLRGKRTLIVFSQGFSCVHCNEQVIKLADCYRVFEKSDVNVLVIVADSNEKLTQALKETSLPFIFLADPELTVFKKFGLDATHRTHGVAVLDSGGVTKWASIGHSPEMDMSQLIRQVKQVAETELATF